MKGMNEMRYRTIREWWCRRCERWMRPRDEQKPRRCAKCKSPYWNKPKRRA
jgi:predicted Zn-ribbon and HTH transcriptional regulator